MRPVLTLSLGMAAAIFVPAPASAESAREAMASRGRIEAIQRQQAADVRIRGRNGVSRIAQPNDYLAPGDHVLLGGRGTQVRLFVRGRRGQVTLRSNEVTDFAVDSPPTSGLLDRAANFLDRFNFVFSERRSSSLSNTSGRITNPDLSPAPVLTIGGVQRIAPGSDSIFFAWRGQAQRLRLLRADGGQISRVSARNLHALSVAIAPTLAEGTLEVTGNQGDPATLRFVRSANPPPLPPYQGATTQEADAQLLAATWLATEGPEDWRLEGRTRLAKLAETDFVAADLLNTITR